MDKRQAIKEYLLAGNILTSYMDSELFQTCDIRKYISDINRKDFPVSSEWDFNPATGTRFKIYYIDKKQIKKIRKEQGYEKLAFKVN